MSVGFKPKLLNHLTDQTHAVLLGNTFYFGVVKDMLFNRHCFEDKVWLGAVADQLSSLIELFLQIVTTDGHIAVGRGNLTC